MVRALFFSLLLLGPLAARAQQLLDGAAFGAMTEGRTYVFSTDSTPYGAEQYLPGNRVNWSFLDGRCLAGKWWEEAGNICFAYEDRPERSQCWQFWRDGDGLRARVVGPGADAITYFAEQSHQGLYCMGPDTGV